MDCIFCKIVAREIPANIVYQDDRLTAFRDLNPQAPVHILIVPNEHIPSTLELQPVHDPIVGEMVRAAAVLAEREGVAQSGFRLVINTGADAGQTVQHIHIHLLGGRAMQWPPG
ncbi:MAG: histidine triad nucleotide-binding protein [Chloroflexota bacterium]|jgi:histidine triad (HIT) family protein